MRRRGVREALVIDEHGGTAGMVTFESLMERIVGELSGTGGPARINVLPDGSAEIDGLVLASEVNLQFGLHIDQDTYTTVGGYVLGQLGRRPRIGDVVAVEGRTMRVDALDGIRVARVWLSTPARRAARQGRTRDRAGAKGAREARASSHDLPFPPCLSSEASVSYTFW